MKLPTLADVRDLVDKHLPEQYRRKPTWRHVSTEIVKAAEGDMGKVTPRALAVWGAGEAHFANDDSQ
jgi:hypothetical protein